MLRFLKTSRIFLGFTLVLFILLVASWFTTTPDELGPFGITLWFLGLFLTLSGCVTLVLHKISSDHEQRSTILPSDLRHGLLVSLWTTAAVALNSLKQLGIKDIILITLLVILIEFYMRRK